MALLACLCTFTHLFAGLTNRSLRELMAALLPGYTAAQMTYDLRRLRGKGLIQRIPRSHRYELTELAAGSPSSLRRPTPAFSSPASSSSTRDCRTTSPPARNWPEHGEPSNARSTPRSIRPLSRPDREQPKHDRNVNN
jgi:hypothetical protein